MCYCSPPGLEKWFSLESELHSGKWATLLGGSLWGVLRELIWGSLWRSVFDSFLGRLGGVLGASFGGGFEGLRSRSPSLSAFQCSLKLRRFVSLGMFCAQRFVSVLYLVCRSNVGLCFVAVDEAQGGIQTQRMLF